MAKEKSQKNNEQSKESSSRPEGLDYEKQEEISSTQQHLDIDRIRDGVIITKSGGMRIVLMVSAVNFGLKNEEEQNAIIGGYQNFLNSLSYPIQIVAQSRKLELSKYLKKLEELAGKQSNELLRVQMLDYIDFVRRLLDVANIMDKQFYVVVPYEPFHKKSQGVLDKIKGLFMKGSREQSIEIPDFEEAKKEIRQRASLVASGLGSLGVRAVQLSTEEIIELLYTSYNAAAPQFYQSTSPDEVMTPIVEKQPEKEESKKEKEIK